MAPGYYIRDIRDMQVWSKALVLRGVSVFFPNHKASLTRLETSNTAPVPLKAILLCSVFTSCSGYYCVRTGKLSDQSEDQLLQ